MIPKDQSLRGPLAIMTCAFLWSTAGLFITVIDWNPFLIAGLRSLTAGLFIWLVVKNLRFSFTPIQILAAVANSVTMIFFVVANKTTTPANAILLQYAAPIFTALLGYIFLREKLRWHQGIALVLTLTGLFLLFGEKVDSGQWLGNLLALGSALSFAVYFILMRKQKDGNPMESALLSNVFTAAIGLTVAAFLPLPNFTPQSIGALLFLGLIQIGAASLFFIYGIKRVSALTANLLAVIEPVFNPIWVLVILHKAPSLPAMAGGALILLAVTGSSILGALGRRTRESN